MSVNGLYGLSGEQSKQKRREKLGIPEGVKAGKDYVEQVWLPSQQAGQTQQPPTPGTIESALGLDLPKKLAGMPTWMWLTGAGIMVMFFMKGSSKGRK